MRARSALAFAAGVVVGAVATYVRRPRRTVTTHTSSAPTVVDHLDQIRDNVAHARANVADVRESLGRSLLAGAPVEQGGLA